MRDLRKHTLRLEVQYDPAKTDAESVATALDQLLATALSSPGILDEYGPVTVDEFIPAPFLSADHYRCQDCQKLIRADEVAPLDERDVLERVAEGEELPGGECPFCGAVCHKAEVDEQGQYVG